MAVLRFCRDKRGYEHFYLIEPIQGRGNARVLYWFRTPPGVSVGREPFAEDVRRELETAHPDVAFDWRKILDTPIPSADAEKWRERRRMERAAKALRRRDAEEDTADEPVHVLEAAVMGPDAEREERQTTGDALGSDPDMASVPGDNSRQNGRPGKRRRRGHRRGRPAAGPVFGPPKPGGGDV